MIALVFTQLKIWLKSRIRRGACPCRGTGCGGQRPQVEACSKYVREKRPHVRTRKGSQGMVVIKYCFRRLSPFLKPVQKGFFRDLLTVRPSSLFILCGCISSRSTYLVCAERSFESCSLIIWSWLMLCCVYLLNLLHGAESFLSS